MSESIHIIPYMPSWHGKGQIYLPCELHSNQLSVKFTKTCVNCNNKAYGYWHSANTLDQNLGDAQFHSWLAERGKVFKFS
jgi:hypothetical protein